MIIEDGKALLTASDLTRASGCEWQVLTSVDAKQGRRAPLPAEVDIEALHTYKGTETIQALIIGREITGLSAFTARGGIHPLRCASPNRRIRMSESTD